MATSTPSMASDAHGIRIGSARKPRIMFSPTSKTATVSGSAI
jgi:hypothetical protein